MNFRSDFDAIRGISGVKSWTKIKYPLNFQSENGYSTAITHPLVTNNEHCLSDISVEQIATRKMMNASPYHCTEYYPALKTVLQADLYENQLYS